MPHPARRLFAPTILLLLLGALAACVTPRRGDDPLATALLPAPAGGDARVLVVVLPGRGDDLDGLRRSGIAAAIQRGWPQADVLLVEMTLGDYYGGQMPQRLHRVLARQPDTYRERWLVGASMGGMGTLLYEQAYPGAFTGLVLLAPYLGDRALLDEVAAAGLAGWQPGPVPVALDAGNYQREVWRDVQAWRQRGRGADVWLAYGVDDRLAAAMPTLVPALPAAQVLARPGGHQWVVWTPAAEEIFATLRRQRDDRR